MTIGAKSQRGDLIAMAAEGVWRGSQIGQVPEPRGAVLRGGQPVTVGAEANRADAVWRVAQDHDRSRWVAGGQIPQPDGALGVAGGQPAMVGAEGHRIDRARMPAQ